jgi:hypothetical protein
MKNGRSLGQSGRFTQLAPVIRRSFDIASMARLSVGANINRMKFRSRRMLQARGWSGIIIRRVDAVPRHRGTGNGRAPSGLPGLALMDQSAGGG